MNFSLWNKCTIEETGSERQSKFTLITTMSMSLYSFNILKDGHIPDRSILGGE